MQLAERQRGLKCPPQERLQRVHRVEDRERNDDPHQRRHELHETEPVPHEDVLPLAHEAGGAGDFGACHDDEDGVENLDRGEHDEQEVGAGDRAATKKVRQGRVANDVRAGGDQQAPRRKARGDSDRGGVPVAPQRLQVATLAEQSEQDHHPCHRNDQGAQPLIAGPRQQEYAEPLHGEQARPQDGWPDQSFREQARQEPPQRWHAGQEGQVVDGQRRAGIEEQRRQGDDQPRRRDRMVKHPAGGRGRLFAGMPVQLAPKPEDTQQDAERRGQVEVEREPVGFVEVFEFPQGPGGACLEGATGVGAPRTLPQRRRVNAEQIAAERGKLFGGLVVCLLQHRHRARDL